MSDSIEKSFSISYSLENGEFFRRECSSCGLNFKIAVSPSDISHILSPEIQKIYNELTEEHNQNGESVPRITCPYCGHSDEIMNMSDEEFIRFFMAWVHREIVLPTLNQLSQSLENIFGGINRSSGGLLSLDVSFAPNNISKSARPIIGPELPDMLVVKLVCCGERIKIIDNWLVPTIICPFCSQESYLT